mmetsp:Transcript_13133/g.36280  ORF Transcript_13133/g.36280 Transcript_13133/m.36280 type:complete len:222 (+) Transcript_13133:39-704(+)
MVHPMGRMLALLSQCSQLLHYDYVNCMNVLWCCAANFRGTLFPTIGMLQSLYWQPNSRPMRAKVTPSVRSTEWMMESKQASPASPDMILPYSTALSLSLSLSLEDKFVASGGEDSIIVVVIVIIVIIVELTFGSAAAAAAATTVVRIVNEEGRPTSLRSTCVAFRLGLQDLEFAHDDLGKHSGLARHLVRPPIDPQTANNAHTRTLVGVLLDELGRFAPDL